MEGIQVATHGGCQGMKERRYILTGISALDKCGCDINELFGGYTNLG